MGGEEEATTERQTKKKEWATAKNKNK